ncbi:7786_t:CDS:1 [Ambispora leptoticha]|uniref:7786_t:CDS:1 n=1 Tax=Ambispora leptoticha TaxID=144679 RepID=A0A9N9FN93_9GLOM|nr:7786_t:CDS:1 [Ambispora leptoticha]
MSHVNNKALVYDTLKTLGRSTKVLPTNQERSTDFFTQDYEEDEIYAPDSFSKFFGDFIIEEDVEDAIKRLQSEIQAKIEETRAMSDDSSNSSLSDEEELNTAKVTGKKNQTIIKVFKKMLKLS